MEIENPVAKSYSLAVKIVNREVYQVTSYSMLGTSDVTSFDGKSIDLPGLATLCLNVCFRPQEYGERQNNGELVLSCEEVCSRLCSSLFRLKFLILLSAKDIAVLLN